MKKCILFLLFTQVIFLSQQAFATHFMGGEITWECMPNGNYRFKMRLYRECYVSGGSSAASFASSEVINASGGGVSTITMTRVSLIDISPQCNSNASFPHIICPGMANGNPNIGAMQENYYTSDYAHPTGIALIGVPPPSGWTFSFSGCCRNPSSNITNSSSIDWFVRSTMYPYNNQNASPCFDWSPAFVEPPVNVLCSGYPYQLFQNITDNEKDSLNFEWGQPHSAVSTPINSYATGYSFNFPLPGILQNPNNITGTISPIDGNINFTSFTNGAFIICVKVTAYRCGIKVAEIWRDIQVVLIACATNNPPNMPAPFINPYTGSYSLYVDTVFAGDMVSFPVSGTDMDFLPNNQPQTVKLQAYGQQFGNNFTSSTTGCLQPPCATLNPPPPISTVFAAVTSFTWQTTCAHLYANLGCGVTTNKYTFFFKLTDDFCPVPGIRYKAITIYVLDTVWLPAPRITCTRVLPGGDVEIQWQPVFDSLNTFASYNLYSSNSLSGPYNLVGTINNKNISNFVDTGANPSSGPLYYYIQTASGCYGNGLSSPGDTVSTIHLNVSHSPNSADLAILTWNPPLSPNPSGLTGVYSVYREYPTGVWSLLDSTTNHFYTDTAKFCNQVLKYRIETPYTYIDHGIPVTCQLVSNVQGGTFSEVIPPPPTDIENLSYQPSGDQFMISWYPVTTPDLHAYILQRNSGYGLQVVDTILAPKTFFTDSAGNSCHGGVSYSVYPTDSCWNKAVASTPLPVFEINAQYSFSNNSTHLSWSAPTTLLPNVHKYTSYYMKNYGIWTEYLTNQGTSGNHYFPDTGAIYCYYVKAFDSLTTKAVNSCPVCVQTGIYTGTISRNNEDDLVIFPIPAKAEIRIKFGFDDKNIRIKLLDLKGNCLQIMEKYTAVKGEEVLLSVNNLPGGVYMMHIQTEKHVYNKIVLLNK